MLVVQTSHPKELCQLEEEFDRKGDFFSVPLENSNKVYTLIEGMIFEVLGTLDQEAAFSRTFLLFVEKMKKIYQDLLSMRFSLSDAREVLEIAYKQQKKNSLYHNYIATLDQEFEVCADEDSIADENTRNYLKYQEEISKLLEEPVETQFGNLSHALEIVVEDQQTGGFENTNSLSRVLNKVPSICSIISPKNEDASTMHTLKSQFDYNPKFFISNRWGRVRNIDDEDDQRESVHYSQCSQQLQETPNDKISSEQLPYQVETKQKETMNIKLNQSENKEDDDSFADLSGRIRAAPSFLYNQNITEMIAKEENEDIMKSSILKKSIHDSESEKKSAKSGKTCYSSNLRNVRFQNKLRKNSKRSVRTKQDLSQNNEQLLQLNHQQEERTKKKPPRFSQGLHTPKEQTTVSKECYKNQFFSSSLTETKNNKNENSESKEQEVCINNLRTKSKFFKFKKIQL